jgi:glutaredoxin-related protein|tara:strand:- start:780 stop:1136 length:357 start_codon:yes stop_codon:yes gene_type:complete
MNKSNNVQSDYLNLIIKNNIGIFIISKDTCPLCEKLKDLFDTLEIKYSNFKYQETDEEKLFNFQFKNEMKHHTNGNFFPFCYFNGSYVGGYKEIHQNLLTGKLKEQLNDIGLDYEEDF